MHNKPGGETIKSAKTTINVIRELEKKTQFRLTQSSLCVNLSYPSFYKKNFKKKLREIALFKNTTIREKILILN